MKNKNLLHLKYVATGAFVFVLTFAFPIWIDAQTTQTQASISAPAKRTIAVNVNDIKGTTVRHYRTIGAGRVGEGRYADWQKQLKLCREELGIDSLRCHGLLHDELGVYREDAKGNPIYNFQYIDMVYDYLLAIGVRPFVEFGFMPDELATIRLSEANRSGIKIDADKKRRVTVFMWKANVTPPKDIKKWSDLITALTQHWTERYGQDEVKQWLFEIWNEPNHQAFWSPNDENNRMQEYFDLFRATAQAVKKVNPAYRVGGPAAAGTAWVGELIDFCAKQNVPLDFISFHAYGLGGGPGGLDEFGDRLLYINPDPRSVANTANSRLPVIAKSAKPGLPIHITEWSASYSSRDPVHDDYFSAPYILEQLKNTPDIASMSYWTFTDIFEEVGIPPRPFHGGFGLLTTHGIKKPSYFAYRFLHRLGDRELVNSDSHSWVCLDKAGGIQILFWDMTMPDTQQQPNNALFRTVRPARHAQNVTFLLEGLKPGRYQLSLYGVGYEKNDTYTAYLRMGAPKALTAAQVEALKAKTTDLPERQEQINIPQSGKWESHFPLRTEDVVLIELRPN